MELTRRQAKYYIQEALKKESDKDLVKHAVEYLKNRVDITKIQNLFTKQDSDVFAITDGELYWILRWLDMAVKEFNLNSRKFDIDLIDKFRDAEISGYQMMYIKVDTEVRNTIILDNVRKISEREYFIDAITYHEISDGYEFGISTYNYEVQRGANIVKVGAEIFRTPKIFDANISDIKKRILKKDFFSNTITWNVLDNGEQLLEWEEYEWSKEHSQNIGQLRFTKTATSICNIIDGFHRSIAISQAVIENPELTGTMKLQILQVDVPTALSFIEQEASGTPISVEKKTIAKGTLEKSIADYINTYGTNQTNSMKDKIGEIKEVELGSKIVSYYTIVDSMQDKFNVEYAGEVRRIGKFLVDFYNELLFILKDDFSNIMESRKTRVATYDNIFYLYNFIATKIEGTENWQELLEIIIKRIDFDKDSPVWKKVKVTASSVTSINVRRRLKSEISKYGNTLFYQEVDKCI